MALTHYPNLLLLLTGGTVMGNKVWVCDDEPSARYPVYTRGNVGEVFVEAVSPLTWMIYLPMAIGL